MAEIAVKLLLNELSRVLQEEVNLQRVVKQEIEKVREKLEAMKAFLRFADAKAKKEYDPISHSWIRQMIHVAFNIEDVLDEFLLSIAPRNTCLGSICSPIRKWKAKHQNGSDLRSIQARVNELAEELKGYFHIPSAICYEQGSSSAITSTKEIDQFRRDALLVDESQLVGIDATKKMLVDCLKHGDPPNLQVLTIFGMGGLGKTTLAKQIYRDNVVTSQFKKRAFVTVSQSLNGDELLKDIIQQLFPNEIRMQQLLTDRLVEKMKERLQNERYLIVLDGVRKIDHLDKLKLAMPANNNCGSRVVITTRATEVARYSSKEFKGIFHNLQRLSESDSWNLFCEKTFPGKSFPSNLEPICQQILKSVGNPLLILTIGGLLATIDEHNIQVWWDKIKPEFVPAINSDVMIIDSIFRSIFDDLPYQLKSCYMFLSIFPEDYVINCKRLIRLWISEGFVKEDGRTLEEVAYSYIQELLNRSLIQIAQMRVDGRVKSCSIHNLLRECVIPESREQRFVEVVSRDNTARPIERARRLSIHHQDKIEIPLLPGLRSLFLFEEDGTLRSRSKMPELSSDGFKLLKVLDLTGVPLLSFPEEISTLLLLRYLSLRNTKISKLPKSIRTLRSLETLDLKQTFVTELPSEISMLQKLRHLLIRRYTLTFGSGGHKIVKISSIEGSRPYFTLLDVGGLKVTPNIGGLVSLQKLCFLEAPEDSELIKVLGRLTQLRKLCLVNLREQHWRELCSSISKMRNLRSLTLHTTGSFDLQYMSSPPLFLQRLHLTGHLDELPSWVCSLQNLQVLHLMFTKLKKDPTACLEGLSNLVVLVLYEALDGMKTCMLPSSFSSLEVSGFGRQDEMIIGVRNAKF